MWNTGCNRIGNALEFDINILDGENQKLALTVSSHGAENFNKAAFGSDVIFPWCDNLAEVKTKAFRVSSVKTGTTNPRLYLFQEFKTNNICWSLATDADPWVSRRVINDGSDSTNPQAPMADLDIVIQGDRVWGVPATDTSSAFKAILDAAIAAAAAGGAIAAAFV